MTSSTTTTSDPRLVICVSNAGYEASLERRKLYNALPDPDAEKHQLIRVVDESGEDYLYPESFFLPVTLPPAIREAVLATA